MSLIVALTGVWLREVHYDKGTAFVVVDEVKDGQTPVQVDPATAGAWLRSGWAAEQKAPSPGADAPPSPRRGEGKKG